MREHRSCPECDSSKSKVIHTEWHTDYVERVRLCNDCPAEWVVNYGNPEVMDVRHHD